MPSNIYINRCRQSSNTVVPVKPEVRAFHRSLPNYAPTPLISLPDLAREFEIGHVLLKYEGSRLGLPAFKILGASWATARSVAKKLNLPVMNDREPSGGSLRHLAVAAQAADLTLYAATDGNHGRAVARMATYLGIKARIYVPHLTDDIDPEAKSNIASEGAEVQIWDGDYDATVLATKVAAEDHENGKGLLISDTPLEIGDEVAQWIVDGYQTMFDEIEEQVVDITGLQTITHVVTPVGSGSLCQAVLTHSWKTSSAEKPLVITVEPEAAACLKSGLEAGQAMTVKTGYTICTGMCCGTLSATAWPILRDGVNVAVTIEDREVDNAIATLERLGIRAGPCGAASLSALRTICLSLPPVYLGQQAVVVILCTEAARKYQMKS